jgi:hypothetical protein
MIRGWECRWGGMLEPCDVEVEHEDDRTYACAVWLEEAELNDELTEHVNMLAREWLEEYGDYLYEQAKDRRLGL